MGEKSAAEAKALKTQQELTQNVEDEKQDTDRSRKVFEDRLSKEKHDAETIEEKLAAKLANAEKLKVAALDTEAALKREVASENIEANKLEQEDKRDLDESKSAKTQAQHLQARLSEEDEEARRSQQELARKVEEEKQKVSETKQTLGERLSNAKRDAASVQDKFTDELEAKVKTFHADQEQLQDRLASERAGESQEKDKLHAVVTDVRILIAVAGVAWVSAIYAFLDRSQLLARIRKQEQQLQTPLLGA